MEVLAEPVISRLLGSVTNLLEEKVLFIFHAKKYLEERRKKVEQLQKALKDVDRKPFFSNQRDRDREGELKDVIYDAQDIIEKYRTKIEVNERGKHSILQNKVQKLSSSFNEHVSFAYWLGKKIKKVNKRLDKINIDWLKTTPKEGVEGPVSGEHDNPRETTQHIGAQAPIGRKEDKEKIKNLLLHGSMESGVQEENGVSIISIVGQGGIGKTTLAKMVFGEVEKQFGERRWWVCVSERPNPKGLLKKILKEMPRASKNEPEDINSLSLNGLCTRLKSELSKERFLLVLDDLWELYWWHGQVEGTLMKGAMGSKILITTRNANVSKGMNASYMHKVPILTFDESWHLFLKMASKEGSELVSHNLKDIATNIVKKCGGLPLVVQTVGSLMRTKEMEKDDWEAVEKSEIWKWEMAASSSSCEYGDILPGLILSYDDLPLSLKTCFVYCSIFPKDYEIKREKLIMQWVAHELIEENKGIDVEVTANQYVNNLIRRCLIEETIKGDLKLHDILHDLASYIGGKEYSHDFAIEHTRHTSLLSGVDVDAMPSASRGKYKLRTLLSTHESYFLSLIVADFTNFKWLRVLSLGYCEIDELPQSIGYLSLLKYLDLSRSRVRKLPTSIGRLCNLQTMNLYRSRIEELPKEMGELCNLRYLGLEGTQFLKFVAEGLGKLSNLRTLKGGFRICDDRENTRGCNMRELKGLNKLKGELSIEGLGRSRKAIHHASQLLKEKCGLISLKLDFSVDVWAEKAVNSASEQSDTLEALEPPRGLKELRIYGYKGQVPGWLLQPNYAMLQTLELAFCPTLCEIPIMPLPSLKRLKLRDRGRVPEWVWGLSQLEELELKGFTEEISLGGHWQCLQKLRRLRLYSFQSLKSVVDINIIPQQNNAVATPATDANQQIACLSTLQKLEIWNCPTLDLPQELRNRLGERLRV